MVDFFRDLKQQVEIIFDRNIDDSLRLAVLTGDQRHALRLLKRGANVKKKDSMGLTNLHMAIIEGHYQMIKPLIEYGNGIEKEMMLEYKPIVHSLVHSPKKDECLEQLLACNVRIDTIDFHSNTLLHMLVKFTPSKVEFIKKVVFHGVDPGDVDVVGNNCLHFLANSYYCGPEEIESLGPIFLAKGLDINAQNFIQGETALHIASRRGQPHIVDFLLREGAAIDVVDKYEFTALGALLASGSITVISVFLKHLVLRKHRGEGENENLVKLFYSDSYLRKKYHSFEEALMKLKKHFINLSYNISYYDILCRSKYKVARYLKIKKIKDNIRVNHCACFAFFDDLEHRVNEATDILESQKAAFDKANIILKDKLPYVCVLKVSEFLAPHILRDRKNNRVVET